MVARKIPLLTILLICYLLGSWLGAVSKKEIYNRQAVNPPVEKDSAEGITDDEIDREIEKYFKGIENPAQLQIEDRRLERLFQDENGAEDRKSGSHTFHNHADTTRINATEGLIKSHTVEKGDTIWGISRKYQVTPEHILKHNPVLKDRPLYIGEEVMIVAVESRPVPVQERNRIYRVRQGDCLGRLARRYRVSVHTLRQWNGIRGSLIRVGQRLVVGKAKKVKIPSGYQMHRVFIRPVPGRITSPFGRRRNPFMRSQRSYHKGLDIGAGMGTPVHAARSGLVIYSRRMGGYGNCVFIRHAGGYVTAYAHNKKNLVNVGDVVRQGQVIAEVGRTGSATGPHLHFEVRKWKRAINPLVAFKLRELIPSRAAAAISAPQEK